MSSLRIAGLICALGISVPTPGLAAAGAAVDCPHFAAGKSLGRILSSRIREASGIAASQRNPGVYYVNNDSGGGALLFAISEHGRDLGTYLLRGVDSVDWEDMAVGPAPGKPGSFIYVADIGDNQRRRGSITIYRVPEPEISLDHAAGIYPLEGAAALRMRYPASAAFNAETLLIDPQNADLYIVTKERKNPTRIFRYPAPHRPHDFVTLDAIGTLQHGPNSLLGGKWVTGGDISSTRRQILLRSYSQVFLWNRSPGQSFLDAVSVPPCVTPHEREPQGEAIAWRFDGSGYVTLSEGLHQPLHFFARTPP